MKSSNSQLALIRDLVSSISGPQSAKIVDLLYGKKHVNEFTIADKLGLTINQTRNILYKLSDEGLVSFVRKKDAKNGGWYTYYWTLEVGKSIEALKKMLIGKIEGMEKEVSVRKSARFYYCPACEIEYTEENALLNSFVCPECGTVLELRNNDSSVAQGEKDLIRFRKELESVNSELEIINKEVEVARLRREKTAQKKRKKELALRREERLKAAGKTVKEKPKAKKKAVAKKSSRGKKK